MSHEYRPPARSDVVTGEDFGRLLGKLESQGVPDPPAPDAPPGADIFSPPPSFASAGQAIPADPAADYFERGLAAAKAASMGLAPTLGAVPPQDGLISGPVLDLFERHMEELREGRAILAASVGRLEESLEAAFTAMNDRIGRLEKRVDELELGGSEDWKRGITDDGDDD